MGWLIAVIVIGGAAQLIWTFWPNPALKQFVREVMDLPAGQVHSSWYEKGWIKISRSDEPSEEDVRYCATVYHYLRKHDRVEHRNFATQAELVCFIKSS